MTMDLVASARFDQAFTFIYSPRQGTPAATMDGHVARDVAQERFDRLVALVHRNAVDKNLPLVGTVQQVLVEGASKRDESMLTGRTGGNKVVHAPVPISAPAYRWAGQFLDVRIDEAQTWFLSGTVEGYEQQ